MSRTLSVLLLFIVTSILFSQEERYIEVEVFETVQLKPVKFTYQVRTEEEFEIHIQSIDTGKIRTPADISEIDRKLADENFTDRTVTSNYSVSKNSPSNSSILITVNSQSELDRLTGILRSYKDVSGKIISVDYEAPDSYMPDLYDNLYKKAVKNATELASQTGNSIGRLISVSEPKNDMWSGYFDFYEGYFDKFSYDPTGKNSKLTKPFMKRLVFRFEMR